MEAVLAVLAAVLAFRAPGFFTVENLMNILRNVSLQGIIAFGMTMVIVAGEIDLSVGSAVAFSGCLAAWGTGWLAGAGVPGPAAVGAAAGASLAAGAGIGALNGFLRVRFRVPTFITTLAWMTVLRGAAGLITGGFPITSFPAWYNVLGGGYVAGVPVPALFFLGVFAAVQFLMGWTAFGRAVYAVGGNPEAARLSGIPVGRVQVLVMSAVAGLAALSGLLNSSQIMSGSATTAEGWELDVIAAVIIGGTSLMGGAGTVRGTFVGILFLGVLSNGMTLLNFSTYWQLVVRGALILGAVLLNVAPARRR